MKKALFVFLASFYTFFPTVFAVDMLENTFDPTKQNQQIVDLWNNKTAVWNEVFFSSRWLFGGNSQQPLLARILKSIMRVTIILWVSMWIIIWIKYIYSQGNESEQEKLQGYLWNIIYWILIALWALVIIELVLSITRSSITL